ncbi:hypothetical protein I4F81_003627 [Pyropia yezoensis]|uniref:Uncharacterized protein n=1 Tax=Pyropia yezoensis TaxID=2788 RepID=A0ACC3BTW5_PYRYE|nr:hypothetical protein I4F81_003627 [Neopyropia yezoensis]
MGVLGGIDPSFIDKEVSPRQDFYRYAVGSWIDANPIDAHPEHSRWGAFEELIERNHELLRELLEAEAAAHPDSLLGRFYSSGMNTVAADAAGYTPLSDLFDTIDAVASVEDVVAAAAALRAVGVGALWRVDVETDSQNSEMAVLHLSQSGLGLPDRDFYVLDDKASLREQYVAVVARLLTLWGMDAEAAATAAANVMTLETLMARASLTRVERRDPVATYNRHDSVSDLTALTEGVVDWSAYLSALPGLTDGLSGPYILDHPPFFTAVARLLKEMPLGVWRAYLRWQVLAKFSPFAHTEAVDAHFAFFGTALNGQKELKPLYKRVGMKTGAMVEAPLAELYIAKTFSPQAKEAVLSMVDRIMKLLVERVKALDWMGEETKEAALAKLAAMRVKVGYPDSYEPLELELAAGAPYVANVRAGEAAKLSAEMKRNNLPVDKVRWEMPVRWWGGVKVGGGVTGGVGWGRGASPVARDLRRWTLTRSLGGVLWSFSLFGCLVVLRAGLRRPAVHGKCVLPSIERGDCLPGCHPAAPVLCRPHRRAALWGSCCELWGHWCGYCS